MIHYLLYFLAILSLSQSPNWVKFSGAPPLELGFWRLFFASLLWLLLAVFLKLRTSAATRISTSGTPPHASGGTAAGKTYLWAVAAGVVFFFHLWAFHYAAQHTRIANLMILFASNPIFISVITVAFFKVPWRKSLLVAYFLAFGGLIYLFSGDIAFDSGQVDGNVAAILASILFSAYLIASQQARRELTTLRFSLILYPIAALCFLLYILWHHLPLWPETQKAWIAIAGLTVFSTMLGHSLFAYLLKHMNINFMSFGKLIEPILASVAAYFFFGEALTVRHLVAFLFVTGGVVFYTWASR